MGGGHSKLSEEERAALHKSCRATRLAYGACVSAHKGRTEPCGVLETAVVDCLARKLCPEAERAFQDCVTASFSLDSQQWTAHACDAQVAAMKACLQRFQMFPLETKQR